MADKQNGEDGKKHNYPKARWRAKPDPKQVPQEAYPSGIPKLDAPKKRKILGPQKVRKDDDLPKPSTGPTDDFNVQSKRPPSMAQSRKPNGIGDSGKIEVVEAVISGNNGGEMPGKNEEQQDIVNTEKAIEKPIRKNLFTKENAKEMRARRRNYGQKLPPVVCDNCAFSQQCPQFRQGYECAFMEMIGGTRIDSPEDIVEAQKRIIEANLTTAELGLIQQRLSGGIIDDKTSSRLDSAFEQLAELRRLAMEKIRTPVDSIEIKGPGIIEKLFGNLAAQSTPMIEIDAQEVIALPMPTVPEEKIEKDMRTDKERELDEAMNKFEEF